MGDFHLPIILFRPGMDCTGLFKLCFCLTLQGLSPQPRSNCFVLALTVGNLIKDGLDTADIPREEY